MKKMVIKTVYMPNEILDKIKELAQRDNRSINFVMCELLREALIKK